MLVFFTVEGPNLGEGQVWINELCSILTIDGYDSNSGQFTGTHENFVGVAKGQFAVAGFKDPEGNTLGWTLDWENSELDACAVISWSGQTQYLPNGVPVILTTWVITRQTTSEENWSSTLIGTDQFYPINSPPANCGSKAFAFFSQRG